MRKIIAFLIALLPTVIQADGLPITSGVSCPDNSRGQCCASGNCGCSAGGPGKPTSGPSPFITMGASNSPMLPPLASSLEGNKEILQHGLDSVPTPKMGILGGFDSEASKPIIDRLDCDYSSNGLFGLTFGRQYIGQVVHSYENWNGSQAPMGPGWTHNYELYLQVYGRDYESPDGGTYALRTPGGRLIQFADTETANVWRADPNYMSATLVRNFEFYSDELETDIFSYVMTVDGNSATYYFDHFGRLKALRDRNGNGLDFCYHAACMNTDPEEEIEELYPIPGPIRKISATAPDDRYLTFDYTTHNGQLRLEQVNASWTPRIARFTYDDADDANGVLSEVFTNDNRLVEKYVYGPGRIPAYLAATEPLPYDYNWLTLYQPDSLGNLLPTECYKFYIDGRHGIGQPILERQYNMDGTAVLSSEYYGFSEQAGGFAVQASSYHTNYPPFINYYENGNLKYTDYQDFGFVNNNPIHNIWNGSRRPTQYRRDSNVTANFTYKSDSYVETSYDTTRLATAEYIGKPKTHYYYNSMGRVTGQWTADDRYTSYTYDVNGNVIGVNRNGLHSTTYTLDAYGRVVTQTTPIGTTTYVHDNRGHVREIIDVEGRSSIYDFDGRDRKTSVVSSEGTTTTYSYDDSDRLTTVTDAQNNKTVYTYDWRDRVVKVTDPLLEETTYEYSPTSGTLTSVTDPEGGVVHYEYDLYGRVTKLTDQRNYSTTYEYDATGRLIAETNPLNQTTHYTYHEESGCSSCGAGGGGHLASKTSPDGKITEYEYDSGGRLTNTFFLASDGVTIENSVIHTYDDYGRKISTFDDRLPVGDFPTQTFFYDYDDFDRVVKETYPDGEEVAWSYDVNGRRTGLTDPDENLTEYVYWDWPECKRPGYTDHPFGGTNFNWYYQDTGRLWQTQNYTSFSGVSRHEDGYYYDSLGRLGNTWSLYDTDQFLIQLYHHNADSTINHKEIAHWDWGGNDIVFDYIKWYGYDGAKRLLWDNKTDGIFNPLSETYYAYDLAGNRTAVLYESYNYEESATYSYNGFNQVTNRTDYTPMYFEPYDFEYDLNGNQTTESMYSSVYQEWLHDRNNRMVQVNDTSFVYDYNGRLLMKNAGGTKTKYYYDGINTLLTREKPGGGACWRTKTVYALENKAIGQVMATRDYEYAGTSCTPSDHEDTWYKYDHIGNVMATFDDAGALKSNIEMEAFGKVRTGTPGRVQLTTKEFHPDANLYYFGARWYDQVSGRWMETDPLVDDGPNWYHFNLNDPINNVDYDGQISKNMKCLECLWLHFFAHVLGGPVTEWEACFEWPSGPCNTRVPPLHRYDHPTNCPKTGNSGMQNKPNPHPYPRIRVVPPRGIGWRGMFPIWINDWNPIDEFFDQQPMRV